MNIVTNNTFFSTTDSEKISYYDKWNGNASEGMNISLIFGGVFFVIVTFLAALSHIAQVNIVSDEKTIKIYTKNLFSKKENPVIFYYTDNPEIGGTRVSTINLIGVKYYYESVFIESKNKRAYLKPNNIDFYNPKTNQNTWTFTAEDIQNISNYLNLPIGKGVVEGNGINVSGINIYKESDKTINLNDEVKKELDTPKKNINAISVVSLILGLFSFIPLIGILLGLPAIILGIVSILKETRLKDKNIVSIIFGSVGILLGTITIVFYIFLTSIFFYK
ncbi:MAG: DUF4190 domain-containing protein [Candidatus Woesearchaeota archaeon]